MSLRIFCYIIGYALVSACAGAYPPDPVDFFENRSVSFKEKLQKVLESDHLSKLGFNQEQIIWLKSYYKKNDYQPHWVNDSMISKEGVNMRHLLNRSLWFGVPERRSDFIRTEKKMRWVEEEVVLTARFASLLADLNFGFIDFSLKKFKPQVFVNDEKIATALRMRDTLSFDEIVLNQGISDTNYRHLAIKLYTYCLHKGLNPSLIKVPTAKEDSLLSRQKALKNLILKGYILVPDKETAEEEFLISLKAFQIDNGLHPDGIIGPYTAMALYESNYQKAMRAALTLEKIRCRFHYPKKFVRINIPEYLLRLVINDTLRQTHRLIVGKPENKTPLLRSRIHQIILYPYWNVPYSIARKEILPLVKANPSYLEKNHYKIYRGTNEINPLAVKWRRIRALTFPYALVQQPGLHNSLGIIKFEFYSLYSVYLHDTPTKHLFRKDIRAFSHGCIRCQFPDSLAKALLSADSLRKTLNPINGKILDSLLKIPENRRIKFLDSVPVFVEYETVYADRKSLIFFLDIYKRDEEFLKFMING